MNHGGHGGSGGKPEARVAPSMSRGRRVMLSLALLFSVASVSSVVQPLYGDSGHGPKPVERTYTTYPSAPKTQSVADADKKSFGCVSCHTASDRHTMHQNPGVIPGCADCHGGDPTVKYDGPAKPAEGEKHGEADAHAKKDDKHAADDKHGAADDKH